MKRHRGRWWRSIAAMLPVASCLAVEPPTTVSFPSADRTTELVAYVFEPVGAGPHAGIVLLHGRAGPYSANVSRTCTRVDASRASPCNASTLSRRHASWGRYWAAHGYVALVVDSFGPRGRAHGYGRGTHGDPDRDAVNEKTVRPLDAEGALAWLVSRPDIDATRVMLQGWSNGGSTALNVMHRQATRRGEEGARFRAALVFYPGCGSAALLSSRPRVDADVWVYLASADEEVSPVVCARVLGDAGDDRLHVTIFDGATHDFDDPGEARQAVAANRRARTEVLERAAALVDTLR